MSDPVRDLKQELLAAAERQLGPAASARARRRRWFKHSDVDQGRRRWRLVLLAAAVLVIAVGTASAIGGVRDFILDRGYVGLPPEGATPSAPESGELVFRWDGFAGNAPPRTWVRGWVFGDGRIIWDVRGEGKKAVRIPESANEPNSGYLEQRLTPEGVEILRSAVAELFDRSRPLVETVPADVGPRLSQGPPGLALFVPEGADGAGGSLYVPDGDRLLRLQAVGIGGDPKWDQFVREHFEGTIATPEQLSALRWVDALLADRASVLPPSAWAVRKVRAYIPSHYAVCIHAAPTTDASHLFSLLPARAQELLRDKSRTRFVGDVCFKVETEGARRVAKALSGLDPLPGWRDFAPAYRLAEPLNHVGPSWIWFEPYFPHGQLTFSGPFG